MIVAGQAISSAVIDHFGLLGREKIGMNGLRMLGILMILTGVVLISRISD